MELIDGVCEATASITKLFSGWLSDKLGKRKLLTVALMAWTHDDFRLIFELAFIPGMVAVLVLAFGVREPPRESSLPPTSLKLASLNTLGAVYWAVSGVGALFTLGRFSEAFLILRAQGAGLAVVLAFAHNVPLS